MARKMNNPMKMVNEISISQPDRNYFDETHALMASGQIGELMPIMAFEVLPDDIINLDFEAFVRFPPLIAPIMHRFDVYIHSFFVPYRIIWSGWDEFISMQANAGTMPQFELNNTLTTAEERFLDLAGIAPPYSQSPQQVTELVSALPAYAYTKIYNEYYRAQQFITEIPCLIDDAGGQLSDANRLLHCRTRQRAWEHDYFTSCLPEPQIGDAVDIPLGVVELLDNWDTVHGKNPAFVTDAGVKAEGDVENAGAVFPDNVWINGPITDTIAAYDPDGSLVVGATTINQLREAYALQRFLEKLARGGQRYYEFIRAVWGATPSDARLQRPEYITGMKTPVIIQQVLNTAGSTDGTGNTQGYQSGHAVSVGYANKGSFHAEEYGVVMSIMSIMPKAAYMQGISRLWTKTDPWEFGIPDFQHIGEQAVKTRELYAFANESNDDFGYIPRFSEYKFMPSRVAGEFRTSLDMYQCARNFGSAPVLNQEFIEVPQNIADHIFVVDSYTTDPMWINTLHKVGVNRKLAVYSNPI